MRFNSLRSRILILTTVPLTVLLAVFLWSTLRTADDAVRSNVDRSLADAGSVFIKLLETKQSELLTMALVTARDPRFFATFTIPEVERTAEFAPTVRGITEDFLRITNADFIEVYDATGKRITAASRNLPERLQRRDAPPPAVQLATKGQPVTNVTRLADQIAVTAVVPVFVANRIRAVLRIGNRFDEEFVREVERLTSASVALMASRNVIATTFPSTRDSTLRLWPLAPDGALPDNDGGFLKSRAFPVQMDEVDYLAIEVRIPSLSSEEIHAYLGRPLAAELQPMVALSRKLALAGLVALIIILGAAWAVAARTTRPLANMVDAAQAMQRGEYDHPVPRDGADEVAFLARSFDDMRLDLAAHMTRMRNLDQMKSNFITLAGHELRTPLTVITSFNEMILSGDMGEVPETMLEATQSIQDRLSDLNRKVTNILEVSRFEEGLSILQRKPTDITQLLHSWSQSHGAASPGRNLRIEVQLPDESVWADADSDYLWQVLQQLFDNAVRFTPDDGRISVELTASNNQVFIAVRDTGIGIEPEQQRWIFEKSWETTDILHHTSGHLEFGSRGLGLGLALAHSIVRAHEGDIRLESHPGHGSCFTVVLERVPHAAVSPEELVTS